MTVGLPWWRRFPFRVTLLYAVPVYVVLTGIGVDNYRRGVDEEMRALQQHLVSLTVGLSVGMSPRIGDAKAWTTDDYTAMQATFAGIAAAEPDVSSLYVVRPTDTPGTLAFSVDWVRNGDEPAALGEAYDAAGEAPVMLEAFDGPRVEDEIFTDKWGATLSGYAPVRDASGKGVAVVGADVTADRVAAIQREVLGWTALMFGLAGLVIAVVGVVVAQLVRVPLEAMVGLMGRIAGGDFVGRSHVTRADEFGVLARHLDRMAAGLQERERLRGIFGRYVSERVAREVLASPDGARLGGDEREVTLISSDIRSYSTIAEKLTPQQIVAILNAYTGAMEELVDAHGGVIVEFVGDGLVAAFGAPQRQDDHADRAVACARAMAARLDALNAEWERSGLAVLWMSSGIGRLEARLGVHTGTVIAGNLGGPSRVKYTVVGEAVELVSAVEQLNNTLGTSLLVTGATWERLTPAQQQGGNPVGRRAVGRDELELYTFTA